MKYCTTYSEREAVLTPFLKKQFATVKSSSAEFYDKIWQSEDINEPYFLQTKTLLAHMFRMLRGLKLPQGD